MVAIIEGKRYIETEQKYISRGFFSQILADETLNGKSQMKTVQKVKNSIKIANTNKERIPINSKLAFLKKNRVPSPNYRLPYSKKMILSLLNANKYQAANFSVLIVLSDYRMNVLFWIHRIKRESLKKAGLKEGNSRQLSIAAVYFVFHIAKDKLAESFDRILAETELINENLFMDSQITAHKRGERVISNLRMKLREYETIVDETRKMLPASLSFL